MLRRHEYGADANAIAKVSLQTLHSLGLLLEAGADVNAVDQVRNSVELELLVEPSIAFAPIVAHELVACLGWLQSVTACHSQWC